MTPSPLLCRFLTRPPEPQESEFFSLDAMEASPFARQAALCSEAWQDLDPVRRTAWVLLYGRARDHDRATIDLMVHLREWYLALEEPEANEQTLKRLWREALAMERHGPFLSTLFYPLRFAVAFPPGEPSRAELEPLARSLRLTLAAVLASIVGDSTPALAP